MMARRIFILSLVLLLVFSSQLFLVAKENPISKASLLRPGFVPNSLYRQEGNVLTRNTTIYTSKKDPIMQFVSPPTPLTFLPLAIDNQSLEENGILDLSPWLAQSMINSSGHIAFASEVHNINGRNWGIFVANESRIQPIVFGCGSGGGGTDKGTCGDPTPIGGTFSGFFQGTDFAPVITDKGDVLFLADVVNARSPRAIFLYRAVTKDIIKIVAVRDHSPFGGQIGSVGPAAMNNKNEIVFIAFGNSPKDNNFFDGRMENFHELSEVGALLLMGPCLPLLAMVGTDSEMVQKAPQAHRILTMTEPLFLRHLGRRITIFKMMHS